MRSFIAIEVPEEIRTAVHNLRQAIPPDCAKVRWVREQAIHLTLVFLGELFDDQLAEAKSVLARIAKEHHPFAMALTGSGTFPDERRPRVLWAGVSAEARAPITNLAYDLLDNLSFLKLEEKKRFTPHITFGRIKSVTDLTLFQRSVHAISLSTSSFPVKEITLFKSELKPGGAEYTALAKFPLS